LTGIYSSTITSGVTLSVTPATITASGFVTNSGSNAVYSDITAQTLVNFGKVIGPSTYLGVYLSLGGEVINAAGGTISGAYGVSIAGAGASITNSGIILGTSTLLGGGVSMSYGGNVSNSAGGTISGLTGVRGVTSLTNAGLIDSTSGYAVYVYGTAAGVTNAAAGIIDGYSGGLASSAVAFGSAGVVLNAGTIELTSTVGSSSAIFMYGSGYVSNASSGLIVSDNSQALNLEYGTNTVVNAGRIFAPASFGVDLNFGSGGTVINTSSGTIEGNTDGIYADATATIVNAGTIGGGNGTAVYLHGSIGNLVVVEPGAVFGGVVQGGTAAAGNEIEFAAGTGVFSAAFLDVGTIAFAPGATWTVAANTAELASGETITGFAAGDTLELAGFVATSDSFGSSGLVLGSTAGAVTLDLVGNFANYAFDVSAPAGTTNINLGVACFRAGTALLTKRGMIAVEALAVGDRVVVQGGGVRPVVWLGHRNVACRHHPRPEAVWPVRVAAGAFGPGLPLRDLFLSPDHAVFVAGALIPVKHLINRHNITQIKTDSIEYWHVELDRHDVMFAEGLPAESFWGSANRAQFENGGAAITLHPEFGHPEFAARAANLAFSGLAVARARRQAYRSPGAPVALVADSRIIRPARIRGRQHRFVVPPCQQLDVSCDVSIESMLLNGRRLASLAEAAPLKSSSVLDLLPTERQPARRSLPMKTATHP
jgi:hypothetical protein